VRVRAEEVKVMFEARNGDWCKELKGQCEQKEVNLEGCMFLTAG